MADPAFDSAVTSFVSNLPQQQAKTEQALGAAESASQMEATNVRALGKQRQTVLEDFLKNRPAVPDLPEPSPPPQNKPDEPLQNFGSLATLIGIFGGAMTKRPLVASLKAASGAMNGYRQKNLEDFNTNLESWKANQDYVAKLMNWRLSAYQAALKGNDADVSARFQAIAAQTQDESMLANNAFAIAGQREKVLNDQLSVLDKMQTNRREIAALAERTKHDLAMEDIDRGKQQTGDLTSPQMVEVDDGKGGKKQVLAQQHKSSGAWVTADEKRDQISGVNRVIKGSEPAPDDKSVGEVAGLIANYRMAPLSGFTMRSEWGQAVMAKVGELNPTWNAAKYAQAADALKKFGAGRQGDQVRSMNVSIAHLGTFSELADALDNKNLTAINRAANLIKEETGNPAPVNFNLAKQIIGQEITKAIIAGGGGVTERQEMSERINAANSPAQLKGAIATAKQLLAGQLGGLRRQYEQSTGYKNFDDMLSPESREQLEGVSNKERDRSPPKRATLNGRTIEVRNGKWVFSDTGQEVPQ